jgi:hypothetical protein
MVIWINGRNIFENNNNNGEIEQDNIKAMVNINVC